MSRFRGWPWLCLVVAAQVSCSPSSSRRAPPLVGRKPFLSIWNIPAEQCATRHNIHINLKLFQLIGSPKKTATNQAVSLFYSDRLGYYPYLDQGTGEAVNGGIPQFIPFTQHLQKAAEDIKHYIPSENQVGLGVIDWEEWRPSWARNWNTKEIYKKRSLEFVKLKQHTLTKREAQAITVAEFESTAKEIMQRTLALAKQLRPKKQWGYFLFPECYNYEYKKDPKNYTGHCLTLEKMRNDKLDWLWNESTALYPSLYLETALKLSSNAALYSRHRIKEAIRVSRKRSERDPLPIYAYTRPVFTDDPLIFLTEEDLVNSIGEAAALGIPGHVQWGGLDFALSKATCRILADHVHDVLNPYLVNVTMASTICSELLCKGEGACARRDWNSNAYLHLNPQNFYIRKGSDEEISLIGSPTKGDLRHLEENFQCSCYGAGNDCHHKANIHRLPTRDICISEDICIKTKPLSALRPMGVLCRYKEL